MTDVEQLKEELILISNHFRLNIGWFCNSVRSDAFDNLNSCLLLQNLVSSMLESQINQAYLCVTEELARTTVDAKSFSM